MLPEVYMGTATKDKNGAGERLDPVKEKGDENEDILHVVSAASHRELTDTLNVILLQIHNPLGSPPPQGCRSCIF